MTAIAIVAGGPRQILEAHRMAAQLGKREPHVALALVPGVVDGDQALLAVPSLPGPGDEAVRRPAAVPRRHAVEQAPLAVANDRLPEHGQEAVVELLQRGVDRLQGRAYQVRRDALPAAFELPLMKEPQTRRQKRDDGRGLVHAGGE